MPPGCSCSVCWSDGSSGMDGSRDLSSWLEWILQSEHGTLAFSGQVQRVQPRIPCFTASSMCSHTHRHTPHTQQNGCLELIASSLSSELLFVEKTLRTYSGSHFQGHRPPALSPCETLSTQRVKACTQSGLPFPAAPIKAPMLNFTGQVWSHRSVPKLTNYCVRWDRISSLATLEGTCWGTLPSFRLSERSCLKGIRKRWIEKDTQVLLWLPHMCEFMHSVHTHNFLNIW